MSWYSHSSRVGQNRMQLAFTLVEMLVAMAVTLLMMAALARAFAFVGQRVRESRGDTELANNLRDISTRLSEELGRCTVDMKPNQGEVDQLGYFLYYEGPTTDATSSLFRAANDSSGNLVLNDSRYGDFDDYLAFTAVAPGDRWFTGKVPRYILDMKTAELAGATYTLPNPASTAFEPVVIRSKYAEIIYFASPEYATSTLPGSTSYIDVDGDVDLGSGSAIENGLPDRLRLHRRVLLIRPDLNLASTGALPVQVNGTVEFMHADAWPTATTATATSSANLSLGWLYGMAAVHQQCDLSVRRVLNASGLPTQLVAANTLADLSKPHNRFAHVRVPNNVLIGSGTASFPTSMPVLALSGPSSILNSLTTGTSGVRIAPPLSTSPPTAVVTPTSLSGFIRPEFVLGTDYSHLDSSTDLWGLERIGEDILTNNALGLDVQVYDPNVAILKTASFTDSITDLVVQPSDACYREALISAIATLAAPPPPPPAMPVTIDDVREQGGFVDLAYPVLAGGSIRGWQARRLDRRATADSAAINNLGSFLVTPFSGLSQYDATTVASNSYQQSLFQSGRLVTIGNTIRLFQPAFDTYTSFYERDGFYQRDYLGTGVAPGLGRGTLWTTTTTSTGTTIVDEGTDGLDNDGDYGADDLGEKETLAPFSNEAGAIRVTIRVENPKTRQLRQMSVIHRD